jgi:histidinol-phosphatase (PHP family)
MIKLLANRGVSAEAPANKMAAFRYAAAQKYEYFSLDPVCLLGGGFATDIKNEPFAPKFANESAPLLLEVLSFAKENGIKVLINNGFELFGEDDNDSFFDTVSPYEDILAFACTHPYTAECISKKFPRAEIHYCGIVNEEILQKVQSVSGTNSLTVWLLLSEAALAGKVKEYASLGFEQIDEYEDYEKAISLGADIISTNGKIKHDINAGFIADMHSHTENSHDATANPVLLCQNNIARGVRACAFTDHSDGHLYGKIDINSIIGGSVRDALDMREMYAGSLRVFTGVELGESIWHGEIEKDLFSLYNFDVVIGSVHTVRHRKDSRPFAQIDFSIWSDSEVDEFLTMYFDDLYTTVTTVSCDIMAHLTVPFRYIIGKAGKHIDISRYMPKIKQILKYIIDRGIAMEVNTSGIGSSYSVLLPDIEFIKLYRDMGGYLITLGSDAHTEAKAANAFPETLSLLKNLGFKHIYYFEKRIPVQCSII